MGGYYFESWGDERALFQALYGCPQFPRHTNEQDLKFGHDRFLPYPFEFINDLISGSYLQRRQTDKGTARPVPSQRSQLSRRSVSHALHVYSMTSDKKTTNGRTSCSFRNEGRFRIANFRSRSQNALPGIDVATCFRRPVSNYFIHVLFILFLVPSCFAPEYRRNINDGQSRSSPL